MTEWNKQLEEWLNALFDSGVATGGDIVLERQFETDPEAYKRYRARAIKEVLEVATALKDAEVERVIERAKPELQTDFHNESGSRDAKVLATEMSLAYNQGVADFHQNLINSINAKEDSV